MLVYFLLVISHKRVESVRALAQPPAIQLGNPMTVRFIHFGSLTSGHAALPRHGSAHVICVELACVLLHAISEITVISVL
jgi:hypothetical protein